MLGGPFSTIPVQEQAYPEQAETCAKDVPSVHTQHQCANQNGGETAHLTAAAPPATPRRRPWTEGEEGSESLPSVDQPQDSPPARGSLCQRFQSLQGRGWTRRWRPLSRQNPTVGAAVHPGVLGAASLQWLRARAGFPLPQLIPRSLLAPQVQSKRILGTWIL